MDSNYFDDDELRTKILYLSGSVPALLFRLESCVRSDWKIDSRLYMEEASKAFQRLEEAFDEWDRE